MVWNLCLPVVEHILFYRKLLVRHTLSQKLQTVLATKFESKNWESRKTFFLFPSHCLSFSEKKSINKKYEMQLKATYSEIRRYFVFHTTAK